MRRLGYPASRPTQNGRQNFIDEHLHAQKERLDHADAVEAADPASASQIRQAVIQLYRERPWAAPLIERAKKSLETRGQPKP